MSNDGAHLSVELTEGIINNAIAVAITEAFTPERQQEIIKDVVRAHLAVKKDRYSKETLLGESVGNAVRSMATEHVSKMLEAWRPQVEAMVEQVFGEHAPVEDLVNEWRTTLVARLTRRLESPDDRGL